MLSKAVLFGFLLGVYALTLAPSVGSGHDTAELTTAAITLGVPHPPGYPLFVHLGSWATTAWQVNFLSALWVSLGGVLLAHSIERKTGSLLAGAAAAFSFCFSLSVWRQALIGEVFALHLFLVSLLFWSMIVWEEQPGKGAWLVCLTFGLGAAHHHTLALALPGVLLWAGRLRGHPRHWGLGPLPILAACAIPLAFHAEMMFRARQSPWMNWGDPSTIESAVAHFLRKTYGTLSLNASSGGLALAWSHIVAYCFSFVGYQFRLPVTPLPFLGLWRPGPAALGLAAWWVAFGPFFAILGRQPTAGFYVDLQDRFYASSYFAAAALLGLGVAGWSRRWLVVVLLATGLGSVRNLPYASQAGQYQARDTLAAMFAVCPRDAVFVVGGDLTAGVGDYLQCVEKHRTDLVLIYPGLIGASWFQARLPFTLRNAAERSAGGHLESLEAICRQAVREGRAVFFNDHPRLPGQILRCGLLYRWTATEAPPLNSGDFRRGYLTLLSCPLRGEQRVYGWQDFWMRYMLGTWAESHRQAARAFRDSEPHVAAGALERMLDMVPARPLDWTNAGLLWMQAGRLSRAQTALDRALALDPDYRLAIAAKVDLALAQGKPEEAAQWRKRL